MPTKTILLVAMTGLRFSCRSERNTTAETRKESAEDGAERAARVAKAEAVEAKAALAKRLDQLDAEAKELRAEASRLRGRMSTWDDKVASGARTAKNEVEEGLEKTEAAIKKLVKDLKD